MNQQLVFGGDCVLTLDDIGEFKDYTDNLQHLISVLKSQQKQLSSDILSELKEVMEADPQDIFFLPCFPQFIRTIIPLKWYSFNLTEATLSSIVKFQLLVIQECLFTMSFDEEILVQLVKKCQMYKQKSQFQRLLLGVLFRISGKVVYVDEYGLIAQLWNYLREDAVLSGNQKQKQLTSQEKDLRAAMYLQCCEKYSRSRKMRKSLHEKCKDKLLLQTKLAIVQHNTQRAEQKTSDLKQLKFYNIKLIDDMVFCWIQKIRQSQ